MCTSESTLDGLLLFYLGAYCLHCFGGTSGRGCVSTFCSYSARGLKARMLGAGGADVMGAAVRGHGVLAHDAGRGPAQ